MEFEFRDLDCAEIAAVAVGGDDVNVQQRRLVAVDAERQPRDAGEFVDIAVFGRARRMGLVMSWCCREGDPCRSLRRVAATEVRQVLVSFEVRMGRSGTFVPMQRLVMGTGTDRIAGIRVTGTLDRRVIS